MFSADSYYGNGTYNVGCEALASHANQSHLKSSDALYRSSLASRCAIQLAELAKFRAATTINLVCSN